MKGPMPKSFGVDLLASGVADNGSFGVEHIQDLVAVIVGQDGHWGRSLSCGVAGNGRVLRGPVLRLLDQPIEYLFVAIVHLWVPLDADNGAALVFERLNDTVVWTACRDSEVGAWLVHGLMVKRVDWELFAAVHRAENRAWLQTNVVYPCVRIDVVACMLWLVLVERATEEHIDDLNAAADAENRQLALDCCLEQSEFEIVSVLFVVAIAVRLGPVKAGHNVRPAGEHNAVERVHKIMGVGIGRQMNRQAAGGDDLTGVAGKVDVEINVAEGRRKPG